MTLLAAATWCGAVISRPAPLVVAVLGVGLALVARRPFLLIACSALLASFLGARAQAGLDPLARGPFRAEVTLLTDPEAMPGSVRVEARAGHRHVELRASGGAAGALAARLAGERVMVSGLQGPLHGPIGWSRTRHLVGQVDATSIEVTGGGSAPFAAANRVRRTVAVGTRSLPREARALFDGLVLGDDREQGDEVKDDFRGSGLSHLLAVSGQNVAFVLGLAAPALSRLRIGPRWLATLGLVMGFALLTRFEPSVLRAAAMAAASATAAALGRPASGARCLALAATGLVLVDPLLVASVGFQLSVAASAGILVLAPRIASVLPGPRCVAGPLSVCVAAQLAVAPLLLVTFGDVPVGAIPANLLAGPAAGAVMTWGMLVGVPAGLVGGTTAMVLHLPDRALIWWIAGVARVVAAAPLGSLGPAHLASLVVGLGGLSMARIRNWRLVAKAAWLVLACALVSPALALRATPDGEVAVGRGGRLWRAGGVTVLALAPARDPTLLRDLRRSGVRRVDLLVVIGGDGTPAAVEEQVAHRWTPAATWRPTERGAERAARFGRLSIRVRPVAGAVDLRVETDPG